MGRRAIALQSDDLDRALLKRVKLDV